MEINIKVNRCCCDSTLFGSVMRDAQVISFMLGAMKETSRIRST